jgi:predicted transcriptional regulator
MRTILAVWVTHMKTTIELPDDLLERGKAVARRENSTLKALIEEGLRLALRARSRRRAAAFRVEPFRGDGLTPEFAAAGWEKIRDEIYRDRG